MSRESRDGEGWQPSPHLVVEIARLRAALAKAEHDIIGAMSEVRRLEIRAQCAEADWPGLLARLSIMNDGSPPEEPMNWKYTGRLKRR